MSTRIICPECVKKQEEIYRLREENKRLQEKLRRQEQKSQEGYFGSSTPSSQKPIKEKTQNNNPNKNGGAKQGHAGNGRRPHTEDKADRIEHIECEEKICPDCQIELENKDAKDRSILGVKEPKVEKILYKLHRCRCPLCKRVFSAKAPEVLPKFFLNNELLTHVACEHYVDGIPMGLLEQKLNINNGTLFNSMHHLAELLKNVPDQLIQDYRQTFVKFADETSWRNDGNNGYAWLFSTSQISIYRIRPTRSGSVATEVLGTALLPGVLVVDRYGGYNKAPCKLQYCYEHLRRPIEDLVKEFPNNTEIKDFVDTVVPLLSNAMGLRSQNISDDEFYRQAQQIKENIVLEMNKPADHAGIQNIQAIFQEYSHRLYHWAENRDIPAENNYSERGFRRLVISRKISFGSQSDNGTKTREILMTVLHSLKKRYSNGYRKKFKNCLNELVRNPKLDSYKFLFDYDTS
jgi:transposase